MSASLALQKALRACLIASPEVTALVPPASIVDRNGPPEIWPCIILGEAQEVAGDAVARRYIRVYATLHIWQREPGLTDVKAIVGAIRRTLSGQPPELTPHRCHDLRFESARFVRDVKDQTAAHGIMTIEALIEELE